MRSFSNLASVVLARTYLRPSKIHSGVEAFSEAVERIITGNVRNHNVSDHEISRLRYFMTERKAGCGGRGWWFSGTDAQRKIGGAGLVNCWGLTSDDWEHFVMAQDLLMLGGGVGFTVENKYTSKLPRVKKDVTIIHKATKDADFIVPDSREGWCELLRRTLESWFVTGKSFTYSTVCVRPAGEPISGFGGVSSGPRPLIRMVEKICGIFFARQNRKIRPVDSADIICCIGEMVVSGNVRRSAILILGDAWDKDFLKMKRWDLGGIPTQRSKANFSVNASDAEHDLRPLFWKTYEQGEPFGVVNMPNINKFGRIGEEKEDEAVVVNPCQPAWATVLTPSGISTIGKINIGDTIWSGKQWTKVTNKVMTGVKEVFGYYTSLGSFFGTPNHRIVQFGKKVPVGEAHAIDACPYPQDVNDDDVIHSYDILDVQKISEEEVYDITVEADEHTYWSGGLLVSNCGEATLENGEPCNLQEINLSAISDPAEFIEAARLMHRWGKRVTMENYHWKLIDKVIKRNRRIGTGVTGGLQRPDLFNPDVLDRVYREIQLENESYSKELGIEPSVKLTVIKPSGTMSKMMDCPCEGVHPAYSRYFIQRIRLSSNDQLVDKLRRAGHKIEPQENLDGSLDPDTVVVDFYVKTPDGVPTADGGFDTWDQLKAVQMAQKHWSDQAVSVTVYYKDGDVPALQEWMKDNLDTIKTVSFLRHSGHGFKQAPKEAISEEKYEKLSAKIKPIFLDNISQYGTIDGGECEGGACPVR